MGSSYSPDKEWDVIVVDDPKTINAMASPGRYTSNISQNNHLLLQSGVITVFTGILPICQDEDGLAAVLSHGIVIIQRSFFLWLLILRGVEIGHVGESASCYSLHSSWTIHIFQSHGTPRSEYPPRRFHLVCFSFFPHLVWIWAWAPLYKNIWWIFQTPVLRREKVNIALFSPSVLRFMFFSGSYWITTLKSRMLWPRRRSSVNFLAYPGSSSFWRYRMVYRMFTRLGQVEAKLGKSHHDFFQTHPSSESRVKVRRRHSHCSFLSLTCPSWEAPPRGSTAGICNFRGQSRLWTCAKWDAGLQGVCAHSKDWQEWHSFPVMVIAVIKPCSHGMIHSVWWFVRIEIRSSSDFHQDK